MSIVCLQYSFFFYKSVYNTVLSFDIVAVDEINSIQFKSDGWNVLSSMPTTGSVDVNS